MTQLDQARNLLKDGNITEALNCLRQLHRTQPSHPLVVHYLALAHERRGEYDAAMKVLGELGEPHRSAEISVRQAQNALKLKDYEATRKFAGEALASARWDDPVLSEAAAIMGDAAFKSGNLEEAEQHYSSALSLGSNQERALTGMGSIALTRQEFHAALNAFEQVLTSNPHHARALLGKGLSVLGLGRTEEAADLITQALMLDADNSWALATLLPVLSETGRLQDAYDLLGRYLRHYPDDAPMLLARAGVAFSLGRHEECRDMITMLRRESANTEGLTDLERELSKLERHKARLTAEPALA